MTSQAVFTYLFRFCSISLTSFVFVLYLSPSAKAEDNGSAAMEMMKRTVSKTEESQAWWFQFGPRAGALVPVNLGLRETYGGSLFFYGMGLTGFYQDVGVRVEVEHFEADRLVPLNETNKWRNVQSDLSVTPFWLTVLLRVADEPWMVHVGLGGSVAMVSERYRGEAYTDNNNAAIGSTGFAYRYTDFVQTETMFGFQAVVGLTRHKRFGLELKYTAIPRRGSSGFADLGGLMAVLSMSI